MFFFKHRLVLYKRRLNTCLSVIDGDKFIERVRQKDSHRDRDRREKREER